MRFKYTYCYSRVAVLEKGTACALVETACTVVVLYLGELWYFLIFYGINDLLEYYYGKNGLRKVFAEQNLKLTSTSPFCNY